MSQKEANNEDKITSDWARSAYESANAAGKTATNSIVLVSGGAVVSLFALIGTLFTKHPETLAEHTHLATVVNYIAWAIGFFGVSLLLGVLVAGVTYFSQLANAEGLSRERHADGLRLYRIANSFNYGAMVLGVFALAFMITGAVKVVRMLIEVTYILS